MVIYRYYKRVREGIALSLIHEEHAYFYCNLLYILSKSWFQKLFKL